MPLESTRPALQNSVARYFAATRPGLLMARLLGLATARHDGVPFEGSLVLVTLFFALLAHGGANVLNDYYDAQNGTDARNTERIFPFTGGSHFIQNSVLSEMQTRNFGFALFVGVADDESRFSVAVRWLGGAVYRLVVFRAAFLHQQPRIGRALYRGGFPAASWRFAIAGARSQLLSPGLLMR